MTHEKFTQLYTENERGLYGFVYSLLPNRNAADDVIQAAMVQLWEHFEEYDSARPFFRLGLSVYLSSGVDVPTS